MPLQGEKVWVWGHRTGHCAGGEYRKANWKREMSVWTHLEMTHSWFLCFPFAQLCRSGQPPWGTSDPGSVYNDLGNVYSNDLSVYSQGEWPKALHLKSLKCFYLYFCDTQHSRDRGNVGLLRQPLNIPDRSDALRFPYQLLMRNDSQVWTSSYERLGNTVHPWDPGGHHCLCHTLLSLFWILPHPLLCSLLLNNSNLFLKTKHSVSKC